MLNFLSNFSKPKSNSSNYKTVLSLEDVHSYWREPNEERHKPLELYLRGVEKSEFLLDIFTNQLNLPNESTILEIGCNSGRNLVHLAKNNYNFLAGLDISKNALNLFNNKHPTLFKNLNLSGSSLEDFIIAHGSERYDVIFSIATLEHLHYDSDWAFEPLARMSRQYLITIEDEHGDGLRKFCRNYKDIFRRHKLKEIENISCQYVPGLGKNYTARIFKAPKG